MDSVACSETLCFPLLRPVVPLSVLMWVSSLIFLLTYSHDGRRPVTIAVDQHAVNPDESIPVPLWTRPQVVESIPV